MARYLYTCLGLILFVIAMIGIVLPILPTTPILLLAAVCFAKGSSRVENWFKCTKIYQKHLENFVKNNQMPLKTKFSICIPVTLLMLIPFLIMDNIYGKIFIIIALLFKYYYFTFKIETIS